MEGQVEMKAKAKTRAGRLPDERGQALPFVAIFLTGAVLFFLALWDYGLGTVRVQETIAAADLAAHAGVQEVVVDRHGRPVPSAATSTAAAYFQANRPAHARLTAVRCGLAGNTPYCRVVAMTTIGGKFFPRMPVRVQAVAYLPYGATQEGQ